MKTKKNRLERKMALTKYTWGTEHIIHPLPSHLVVETRERIKWGLKHLKQIKRPTGVKKPIADLSSGELFLRDFKFGSLLRRVQYLEGKFNHDRWGIYEVLEVHNTGEIFRSYFEVHMLPNFDATTTLKGVSKNAF